MDEGVFRTSAIGGFKKEDVLAFIDKLDLQSRDEKEKLEKEIEELRFTLGQKDGEIKNLQQQNEELRNEIEQSRRDYEQLEKVGRMNADEAEKLRHAHEQTNAELDKLRHDLFRAQQAIKEADGKLEAKDAQVSEIEEKYSELETHMKALNKTEDQIGRVLLEAHSTADKVLDNAQRISDGMLNDTYAKIKTISEGIDGFEEQVGYVKDNIRNYFESLENMLTAVAENASNINDKYLKGYDALIRQDSAGADGAADALADDDGRQQAKEHENDTVHIARDLKY